MHGYQEGVSYYLKGGKRSLPFLLAIWGSGGRSSNLR